MRDNANYFLKPKRFLDRPIVHVPNDIDTRRFRVRDCIVVEDKLEMREGNEQILRSGLLDMVVVVVVIAAAVVVLVVNIRVMMLLLLLLCLLWSFTR